MAKRTAAKKVKKEAPKRGRADHDDDQNVAARAGEPIELDGNSQTSDQVCKNTNVRVASFYFFVQKINLCLATGNYARTRDPRTITNIPS